jgi:putative transposase
VLTTWLGTEKRRLLAKYDPGDLSTVFLQDDAGRHWPIRYRDLARPAITSGSSGRRREICGRAAVVWWMSNPCSKRWRRGAVVVEAVAKTKAARREFERGAHLRRTVGEHAGAVDEPGVDRIAGLGPARC